MGDLESLLKDGPAEKGAFLSRIFGLFSEQIVRIWAEDPRSPYEVAARRPTVYDSGRHYTLDFLFQRDGLSFVAEMKCEIQYHNYRYWRLISPSQLDHHKGKRAFKLFLQLAKSPASLPVRAGSYIDLSGAILVWGAATPQGKRAVVNHFGFAGVLTVEECANDLVSWNNEAYLEFLQIRDQWTSSLFQTLREK